MDALVLQCEQCGKPLPAPKRGRVRKYCSSRCRKAAFRASLCVPKPELGPSVEFMRSTAPATLPGAPERQEEARKIVAILRRRRFVGRILPTQLALLVPRGIALADLNLDRDQPLPAGDLARALTELNIADYPQREARLSGGLRRTEPINPPNLLPEGSYEVPFPLEYYEDGFPQLPACLNRRNREGGVP
jgi:hypothetical protein